MYKTMHEERTEWYDNLCKLLGKEVAHFCYPNYFKSRRFFDKDGVITEVDTADGLEGVKIRLAHNVPKSIPGMTKFED